MLRVLSNLSLRWKIMLVLSGVAVAVLAVASVDSFYSNRPKSRGDYLRRHFERFGDYRSTSGDAMTMAAEFLAEDPQLVAALEANDRATAARVFARAVSVARRATKATFVVLLGNNNDPIAVPGATRLVAVDAATSDLFVDVRSGLTVDSTVAAFGEDVFQLSAVPVHGANGDTVGAVVLGTRLEDFLEAYTSQSAPDAPNRDWMAFVDARGHVVGSAFPDAREGELGTALQPSSWAKMQEGPDYVDVIHFAGHVFDFYAEHAQGYTGPEYGNVGTFYIMHLRDYNPEEAWAKVRQSIYIFAGVLVFVLLIGYWLASWITRPITRYITATEDLAAGRGDLTKRLDEHGKDELGQLAHNLNEVFAHTHDLATKVQRAALQVGASSAEISAASKQMLDGAQEQARKTESSTAAVTELSTSIQQVAENALEATRVAKSSGQAVASAIERMDGIRSTVDEAASRIGELGESGKRIGNIVEVIRQISDQTTLLALNAAIEAAHAGEQGRGFAVVADEVSSLAKRVGQSARDIEDLIATIKEQTAEAVRAMADGTREVDAGTKLVTATLADLQKLVQVVEDTANAVQEQAVASDEIARNMDTVQRIAQDVLSSSEEAVAQGDHLHRLAHGLEESVKGFRIDATAGPASDALPARPARAALPAETRDRAKKD